MESILLDEVLFEEAYVSLHREYTYGGSVQKNSCGWWQASHNVEIQVFDTYLYLTSVVNASKLAEKGRYPARVARRPIGTYSK